MKNINYEKFYTKTNELVEQFESIAGDCIKHDNLEHSFFVDDEYKSSIHVPFAYGAYDEEKLIGFLSVYSIDNYNIEFCVFVLPDYRNQEVASNLFFRMVMDYESRSYRVPIVPGNEAGECFVKKMGLTFASCELGMSLSKDNFKAIDDDIVLKSDIEDENLIVHGYVDDVCVGQAIVYGDNGYACIHDVEIDEELRQNGYGYRLMMAVLKDAFFKFNTVVLHLTKENTPALKLYQKIGFKINEEYNYYEI